jgi:hypothetical protein
MTLTGRRKTATVFSLVPPEGVTLTGEFAMKQTAGSQSRNGAPVESRPQFPPAFFRPADAADFLAISRRHLARLTARRVLPVFRLGRKCTLYSRGDLEKAVARFRQSAVGESQS